MWAKVIFNNFRGSFLNQIYGVQKFQHDRLKCFARCFYRLLKLLNSSIIGRFMKGTHTHPHYKPKTKNNLLPTLWAGGLFQCHQRQPHVSTHTHMHKNVCITKNLDIQIHRHSTNQKLRITLPATLPLAGLVQNTKICVSSRYFK